MENFNISLIEEIISAVANIELDSNCEIDYVGVSYDAYSQIKKEVEESLDRPVNASDVNEALTIQPFIMPNLRGIDYKFLKEVSFA